MFPHIRRYLALKHFSWSSLFEGAILCAWAYVFLEWLFIVTKPSFLSAVPLWQKVRVLFFGFALFSVLVSLGFAALFLLAKLIRRQAADQALRGIGALALALMLAALGLLLVDNFTNTVFGFGIASTAGLTILPYLAGFLFLTGYLWLDLQKGFSTLDRWLSARAWRRYFDLGFALIVIAALVLNYQRPNAAPESAFSAQANGRATPNILLITADGLNATHTSLDGYERDTTPRLEELAQHSLVALNAYNNAAHTMGSVVSMYTGRYPTTTRTLYAPDILKGADAYLHLPNMLQQLGYYNIQYTYPHHADAYARNVLAGFDEANGKTPQQNLNLNYLNRYLATDSAYFQYELGNRLVDRLRHITYNKRMLTRQECLLGETLVFHDFEKVSRVFEVLSTSNQPVFAHIHWMGTHGPLRVPNTRIYSKDKDVDTQAFWDDDFYDDSIRDFDGAVGQVVERLKSMGIYDNTILIISSDHSEKNGTVNRIPLLIRFPNDQYQGVIQTSVQIIDLPPTLLDYLGVQQPAWMEGVSLLHGAPEERPIFAWGVGSGVKLENSEVITEQIKPPFYQFGMMSVVYCDAWYELDLTSYQWQQGEVEGAVNACPDRPTDETVLGWMLDRLAADGFDVSSLGEAPWDE